MTLVKRIDTVESLREEFERMNRGNNFTDSGLEVILNHFNEIEEDMVELDVIGICTELSQYTFSEFKNDYSRFITQAIEELGYPSWDFLQGQEREEVVEEAINIANGCALSIQADEDLIVLGY